MQEFSTRTERARKIELRRIRLALRFKALRESVEAPLVLTPEESDPNKAAQEYSQAGYEESWDGR